MQHGVKCVLFATTQTNANRIRDAITTRLPGGVTQVIPPRTGRYHDGRFYVVCSILVPSAALADQFHADVEALWTTGTDATRVQAGSESRRFNSFDDEPRDTHGPDEVTERRQK